MQTFAELHSQITCKNIEDRMQIYVQIYEHLNQSRRLGQYLTFPDKNSTVQPFHFLIEYAGMYWLIKEHLYQGMIRFWPQGKEQGYSVAKVDQFFELADQHVKENYKAKNTEFDNLGFFD